MRNLAGRRALHVILCAGVVHFDMGLRNMLVIVSIDSRPSTSLSVVLFDFAFASQITAPIYCNETVLSASSSIQRKFSPLPSLMFFSSAVEA